MKSLPIKTLKKSKSFFLFLIVQVIALFSFSSCTNPTKPEDSKKVAVEENKMKAEIDKNDAQFLINTAEINLEEIQLGQLAQKNSKMSDVKELGKMMEADHTKALKEVQDLAGKKQIAIPTSLTDAGHADYMNLMKKTGKDFDKTYCDMMVSGHKDAIAQFEKALNDGTDQDIKSWATSMLPGLREHLQHSEMCQKECAKM